MKRIGFLTSISTLGLAASIFAGSTTFETFTVDHGVALDGAFADMAAADSRSATIMPDETGSVSVTFDAFASSMGPTGSRANKGSFSVISRVMGKATQTIELYNYSTQRWERMFSKSPTTTDMRAVVVDFKNPANYVCPMGTCRVKARVTWTGPKFRANFKSVSVDYAEWDFSGQP